MKMRHIYIILLAGFMIGYLPVQAQWSRVASAKQGIALSDQPHALKFVNKDTGYAFVGSRVIFTPDSGHTWNDISPVMSVALQVTAMAWPAAGKGYLVVYNPADTTYHIERTINNGITWDSLTLAVKAASGIQDMAFVDSLHGYIGGNNVLYKTSDGGKVWQSLSVAKFTFTFIRRIFMTDTQNVWLSGYFANSTGSERIVHTINNGNTWDTTLTNPSTAVVKDIHIYAIDTLLAVTDSGAVYISYSGGKTWLYTYNAVSALSEYNFSVPDHAHCFLYNTNQLLVSNNMGRTFHLVSLPAFYAYFQGVFTDSLTGYTLALDYSDTAWHIYKTYNGANCATLLFPTELHVCKNVTFPLNYYTGVGNPDFIFYNWTPVTGLDNARKAHPIVTPANNITYTLTITYTGVTGCPSNYLTDSIKIYPAACDSVWPGDANADLIVDQNDVLNIGMGYGATGPVRTNASILFVAQGATNWTDSFAYGVNYKHADCNGDGVINADDTLAIYNNFSKTHPARLAQSPVNNKFPTVHLRFSKDTAYLGQHVTLSVSFGDAQRMVDSIYGMGFAIQLNPTLIDTAALATHFASNFFTTASNRLSMVKYDNASGMIYACVSRTNQTNHTNDTGDVCYTDVVVIDNLAGFPVKLNPHLVSYDFITAAGQYILNNVISDTLTIIPTYAKGIQNVNNSAANIHVYPTINDGRFMVQYHALQPRTVSMYVTNVLGQIVYDKDIQATTGAIETSVKLNDNCGNGMYWLVITDNAKKYVIPFVVQK